MKNYVLKRVAAVVFKVICTVAVLYAEASAEVRIAGLKDALVTQETASEVSLCAKVTKEYIYNGDALKIKSNITLSPKHHFNVKLAYDEICLTGLKPRTKYKVSINGMISLGNDLVLDDEVYTFEETTKDFSPSYSFPQKGYILPANKEISIPIETRNVERLRLSLYRINTNNLIGAINTYGFFRSVPGYELGKIENSDGYLLWTKELPVASKINEMVTTAIPVGDALPKKDNGVYILQASVLDTAGNYIDSRESTQWFMISDIGLYSMRDSKGLNIYTKSLATAEEYDGIKLELVAKNNEVLQSVTSEDGMAFFSDTLLEGEQGLAPKAIYAYGPKGDFSVLDLSRPAHDLSDRGVEGRENTGRYNAFVYSNRGIFKPSERVVFHALIKNKEGVGQAEVPLLAEAINAKEEKVYTKTLKTDKLGHITGTIELPASAITGKWHLKLFAGKEKPIGELSFLVEDFIPPRVKLEVATAPALLKRNVQDTISIDASYLSGSALADARVEVNTILHKANEPFKAYGGFYFGDINEAFSNMALETKIFKTDANGHLDIPFIIDQKFTTTIPIAAHIDIGVSEAGGRMVHKILSAFVEDKEDYIGIKPLFEAGAVDMGVKPSFEVINLHTEKLSKVHLSYKLIEEEEHSHWRWDEEDEWEYYSTYSDTAELSKGSVETSLAKPTVLTLDALPWGNYRIELRDADNHLTTYRFSSGYDGGGTKISPDRIPVSIDKQEYKVGETLKVNVTAKFTGPALVSIANHEIIETKKVMLEASDAKEIEFEIDKTWGSSAYVLVSAFRPQSNRLGANRAIGVAHIAINHPEEKLTLTLEHPAKTTSKQTLPIVVKAKEYADQEMFVTLAAVDVGILNLTSYQPPNPEAYFFGQQKLGLEIRDIYGELIETQGAHAKFAVGSDEELVEVPSDKTISNKNKVVALFSAVLKFDKNGVATIPVEIPDYQGALKLMAVAWSKTAVGSTSAEMIIKDPVSSELYLPSFISVGDEASTLLSVDFDATVPAGEYDITLSTQGGVSLDETHYRYTLNGQKQIATFTPKLKAHSNLNETGKILLDVSKEGKLVAHREWDIGIRSRYPQGYVKQMGRIGSHESLSFASLIDNAVWSQTKKFNIKLSSLPLLPVASLSEELFDYGGRCAEQTTSRAFPQLYFPKLKRDESLIINAINKLLSYQKYDGGFGLWEDSSASVWVSAYVLDFLTRAKKEGYSIPVERIDKGLNWLENHLNKWSGKYYEQEADVYALYVLTRAGKVLISEMNFYAEDNSSKIKSSLAWAQLGSAFAFVGKKQKAETMFQNAQQALGNHYRGYFYSNYGGGLRDEAALVMLMMESGLSLGWENRYAELVKRSSKESYFSTQEMSVLLRVAYSFNGNKEVLRLTSGGKVLPVVDGEYERNVTLAQELPEITNGGKEPIWYDFSFKGTPNSASYLQKENNGFSISKTLYTMDGQVIEANSIINQNDRLVIVMKGTIDNSNIQEPLVSDWYCAGLEPENPAITGIDATTALTWLEKQTATIHKSYRNDRFEAALAFEGQKDNHFVLAYIVRAVSKGTFTLPPVKIEDMYQPYYRAYSNFLEQPLQIGASSTIPSTPTPPKQEMRYDGLAESDFEKVHEQALKKEDLINYDKSQLKLLRNALIARYGYNYQSSNPKMQKMHDIFSHFAWYKPTGVSTSEVIDHLMPAHVKANVILIRAMEQEK